VTARPDAQAWCEALADALVPMNTSAGLPVRLSCDDDAVGIAGARIGVPRADATQELVRCLRDARLFDADNGVGPLARASGGEPPVVLLGLTVLVLAASRMATDELGSMAAYYRRLAELLDIPLRPKWPQVRGVPELVDRFSDLAGWMERTQQGRRGLLDLPVEVHPSVVGIPIHQAMLRAGDRTTLGAFFDRSSRLIDAGWDPVHQLSNWSGRHQLSQPLQALLGRADMYPALTGAIRAARSSWDGSTIDSGGRRLLPGQLALSLPPLPFTLSVTVPALAAPVSATASDGSTISLDARSPALVPLDWLDTAGSGPVIVDAGIERIRVLPGATMLFEITPLGVQSVVAAADDPLWVLTCESRLIATCDEHQRCAAPLPGGWALLCDIEPGLLTADLRAIRDDDRPLSGVSAVGGLRLGPEVWLLDHPPTIEADVPEPAPVSIDGSAHGDIEPEATLTLAGIAHSEGMHRVEVGEQELKVELTSRGPRTGIGSLAFDANARRVHAGPSLTNAIAGPSISGPLVSPAVGIPAWPLVVRYHCTVDVIYADGEVRKLGPPSAAAWLDHVGLPQDGPWEIPGADNVVWLCVDAPGRKSVVARQAVDVPIDDDVLDVVEWYVDAGRPIDRTGGGAEERWQRLLRALEDAA
jgi:hypothetical protein